MFNPRACDPCDCSAEYAALKEERSAVLWAGLEKIIPDIRQRAEVLTLLAFLVKQQDRVASNRQHTLQKGALFITTNSAVGTACPLF